MVFLARGVDEIGDDGSNCHSQDADDLGGDFADLPREVNKADGALSETPKQKCSENKEKRNKSRKKKKNNQRGSTNRDTPHNTENTEVMTEGQIRRPSCFPHEQKTPWLIYFSHGKRGKLHTLYSLEHCKSYKKSIPPLVGKSCVAFAHSWLLMKDWETAELTMLNPATMERIDLPALPDVSPKDNIYNDKYFTWVVTAAPSCPSCIILKSYYTDPFNIFCYVHEKQWRTARYQSAEKGGLRDFVISDGIIYAWTPVNFTPCVVSFDLYQINFKPLSVLEPYVPFHGSRSITLQGGFGGDLYSVSFIDHYLSDSDLVVNADVFKMDFVVSRWVKVQTIGELTFFVDNVSDSFLCCADNVPGIKNDCVYYMGLSDDILYRYDLTTRGITMESSFRGLKDPFFEPWWVLSVSAAS